MFVKKFTGAIAIFGLMLFMILALNANNVKASYPLDSLWVSPSAVNFNQYNGSAGQEFNLTVWAYMENGTFTWQASVVFNTSLVQAVKAGYTNGTYGSVFFAGHTVVSPGAPTIDNVGGMVQWGETLLDSDFATQTNASLAWVDFKVASVPNATTTSLAGAFDINGTSPADTFFLDANLNTITTTMYGAAYSSVYVPDTIKPTIANPTQVPVNGSIPAGHSVTVSTNVTDNVGGSGVASVTLSYSADNATFTNTTMTLNATTGLYDGTIPGTINTIGTTVYYRIIAYDVAGNYAVNFNTGNWSYYVPEFTSVLTMVMLLAMASAALLMRKKITR
jgi:hypothetical protein